MHNRFTWKSTECFSYIIKISHSREATTSKIFQLQLEGGTNPLVYKLQPEGSYKSLISLAPTKRRLQPPEFFSSNQKMATTTYPFSILPP